MTALSIQENTKPIEDLANAVVIRAVKDYKRALNKLKRDPENEDTKDKITALERFFRSDWYLMLTNVDGEVLIQRLKGGVQSVNKRRY